MMSSNSVLTNAFKKGERKLCISVVILGILIGTVLFAYSSFGKKIKDDPTVKKVFVVFRHGHRTPTETYFNDPHKNYNWPGGWGVLTKLGMLQLYNLGKWIREEYGWLTNYKYNSSNTVVDSSYADRCITSALALVAGLYRPVVEDEKFTQDLPWIPIPVHYVPRNQDKMLVVKAPCPRLEEALKEAYRNESRRSDKELESYYKNLTNLTGQSMDNITAVEFLYNTLELEEMEKLEFPEWVKTYYNEKMREIAARSYTLFTSNTLQQRLRGGPLLKNILNEMQKSDSQTKVYLYSTHDVSIVNTLRAMGFTNELFKLDYGAALIYELRSTADNRLEVEISMLNNTNLNTSYKLNIPGCQGSCLLTDLTEVWKDVLPDDWDRECNF